MISASIFSENVIEIKLKFGKEIEQHLIDQQLSTVRRDFQQFGVNSSLKWRRSRLAATKLQDLSPFPSHRGFRPKVIS